MPIAGIIAGRVAGTLFERPAEIAGAVILVLIGAHALREAAEDDDEARSLSFGTFRAAALAGIAISTDELAVGFPLATAGLPIVPTLAAIAVQAFVVTIAGIALGRRIGVALGRRATRGALILAGVAFVAVGLWLGFEALRHS